MSVRQREALKSTRRKPSGPPSPVPGGAGSGRVSTSDNDALYILCKLGCGEPPAGLWVCAEHQGCSDAQQDVAAIARSWSRRKSDSLASRAKKDRRAIPVLRQAFATILECGYPSGVGLIGSIQPDGQDDLAEFGAAWVARGLLASISGLPSLQRWESNRENTQEDALLLINKALAVLGEAPLSIPQPKSTRRHGGWRVSNGAAR